MSGNDEIERLLREVDASLTGSRASSGAVTPASDATVQQAATGGPGTMTKALIAAVVCGGLVFTATFFLQWLPLIDNPVSSGLGAAVGAFLTALVLGRPRKR